MRSNASKPAAKDRSTLVLAVAPAEAAKASIFLIALRLDRHLLLAVPLEASIFLIACLDRHLLLAVPPVLFPFHLVVPRVLFLFRLVVLRVLFLFSLVVLVFDLFPRHYGRRINV